MFKYKKAQQVRAGSISHSVMQMPQPRHEELFLSAKEREEKLNRLRKE